MIKLRDLLNLKEAEEKIKPEYTEEAVFKFFDKNKKKLKIQVKNERFNSLIF